MLVVPLVGELYAVLVLVLEAFRVSGESGCGDDQAGGGFFVFRDAVQPADDVY
jgi:hypothetical protein